MTDSSSADLHNVAIRTLSLFTGGTAGLDIGVRCAVPESRTVCYVEGDSQAAWILEARIKSKALDDAPIWSDVKTFDCASWAGRIDLVIGGFPCQDVSLAGKRAGIDKGKRTGLWDHFRRIIREVRPSVVFIENVSGLLVPVRSKSGRAIGASGMERVLGDLAELGFDAEWDVFSASEVGAAHERKRVFILAYTPGSRPDRWTRTEQRASGRTLSAPRSGELYGEVADAGLQSELLQQRVDGTKSQGSGLQLANPESGGFGELREPSECYGLTHGNVCEVGNSECTRRTEGVGSHEHTGRESEAGCRVVANSSSAAPQERGITEGLREQPPAIGSLPLFAPGPSDPRWPAILREHPHLAPSIEPGLCWMADGTPTPLDESRTDQLRMWGNGVVPLEAAFAFVTLARRVK